MPALAKAGVGIGERFEQNGTRHPASRTSPSALALIGFGGFAYTYL